MSVTVDREPLAARDLGLHTVGQVLAHLQKDNRLVVQVLIDGEEPEMGQLGAARQTKLAGHTIYIETADPRVLARDVLDEVERQLGESERLKQDAADLLQKNQTSKALAQLGGCIRTWQDAQEAVLKTAELLRIDLTQVNVEGRPLEAVLGEFSGQLKQIKGALEQRDFVSLSDILLYETMETSRNWVGCIEAIRGVVEAIR